MTIALIVGACIGFVIGVYAEATFDVLFEGRVLWQRFNDWRRG